MRPPWRPPLRRAARYPHAVKVLFVGGLSWPGPAWCVRAGCGELAFGSAFLAPCREVGVEGAQFPSRGLPCHVLCGGVGRGSSWMFFQVVVDVWPVCVWRSWAPAVRG